jgi:DUF971 family protein
MDVPDRIEIDNGTDVALTWSDGVVSRLTSADLRAACQCATCREPAGIEHTASVLAGAEPVTIAEARLVGGYAINFVFAPEGHGTGIYPFTALRDLAET